MVCFVVRSVVCVVGMIEVGFAVVVCTYHMDPGIEGDYCICFHVCSNPNPNPERMFHV